MTRETITITDEAYASLLAHNRADESLTDTVLRLTGEYRDVWKGHGAYSDTPGFREGVASVRAELATDLDEQVDELHDQ